MATTDANPPMMPYTDEYTLVEFERTHVVGDLLPYRLRPPTEHPSDRLAARTTQRPNHAVERVRDRYGFVHGAMTALAVASDRTPPMRHRAPGLRRRLDRRRSR